MAKQRGAPPSRATIVARVKGFVQEVMSELKKVAWPSREELKSSTSVVLILLFVFGAIIYLYDLFFQFVVLSLLKLG